MNLSFVDPKNWQQEYQHDNILQKGTHVKITTENDLLLNYWAYNGEREAHIKLELAIEESNKKEKRQGWTFTRRMRWQLINQF